MNRRLLAGFVGALIAFVWSAVVHMTPPVGMMGLSMMNEKEEAVLAGLKGAGLAPGLYFFPGADMSKSRTKAEEEAWTAKFKAGPSGLLLLQPAGGEPMELRQLVVEFLSTLGCALIAATVLATTVGSLTSRALTVALLGLFGWLALIVSAWTWYRYPFSFIAVDLIDQSIGWLLAGFAMAKMIKPLQLAAAN
jgi:hypothetical protein